MLGNIPKLSPPKLHLTLEQWARTYGERYCIHLGPKPAIVLSNPEVIRKILLERPDTYRRPSNLARVCEGLQMMGVFAAEGDTWRRQRKLLNFGFSPNHLENFFAALATISQRLRGVLEKEAQQGSSVDVLRLLMRYTVDVTSIISFGMDLNTVEKGSHPLQQHIDLILPAISQRLLAPVPYWKVLPSGWKMDRALVEIRKAIQDLVAEGRRALEREPERASKPRTMLDAMLVARDEESGDARLSDDEVFANVLTLLVGGEDTTAVTVTWLLYYLAALPAVQARARQEVDAVLGAEQVPTMAHLKQMPYLASLGQETVRMRSPTPVIYLETTQDTVVEDIELPKGTMMFCLTRLPAMDNSLFGDAKNFRPERWLPDAPADTQPHSPRLMLAFGTGGRVCPGRNLALTQCSLVAGTLLRHFELELADPNAPVSEFNAFSVMPVGVNLRFKRRASV